MNRDQTPTALTPQHRREWLIIFALTLAGSYLRLRNFSQLGLTHFDEGIYAQAGLWSLSPHGLLELDHQLISYSPPGYPIAIGLFYATLGVSDVAPLLVAILFGILSIPIVGWVGVRTFGPGAGACSAAFCAFSTAHIAFSRKALTDAPYLCLWIAAAGIGGWFLEKPTWRRALALGLIVGLAQNIKYNGALAGVITAIAAFIGLLIDRAKISRRSQISLILNLLLAGTTAGLVYFPWYQFVESHGTYASLLRHHSSYLGGPTRWLPNVRVQLSEVIALAGATPWRLTSWSIAWVSFAFASLGPSLTPTSPRRSRIRLLPGWLLGSLVWFAIPDFGWWAGLAFIPWLLLIQNAAARNLAIGWLVMSLITPFYHPYARLWLPLHAYGWLLLAGLVSRLSPFSPEALPRISLASLKKPRVRVATCWTSLCLATALFHWGSQKPTPFPDVMFARPTTALRDFVQHLTPLTPDDAPSSLHLQVLARRPVAYYLNLQRRLPFRLLADASSLTSNPHPLDDWLILDETIVGHALFTKGSTDPGHQGWVVAYRQDEWLDPVTQLDVQPESAFGPFSLKKSALVLLKPKDASSPFPPIPAAAR